MDPKNQAMVPFMIIAYGKFYYFRVEQWIRQS